MVGNSLLNFIDQRLQELKGTRTQFGGVSVIAVGDLYQLKPINGDWIFNDLSRLRKISVTENDKRKINMHVIKPDDTDYFVSAPHLFAENYFMHSFNEKNN